MVLDVNKQFQSVINKSLAIIKPLSIVAFSSLSISFFAASPAGRHPYLLYSAFSVPIGIAIGYFKALPIYSSLTSLLSNQSVGDKESDEPIVDSTLETTQATSKLESSHSSVLSTPSHEFEDERSGLDNSVYNNISKSDFETSEEEPEHKTIVNSKPESSVSDIQPSKSSKTSSKSVNTEDISELVGSLIKYGRIITGLASTAFLIVTVGIYGDFH